MIRLAAAAYADGVSSPALAGDQSARAISNLLNDQSDPKDPAADLTGYVHSWEVGSTVDGPGLRFVIFLTGCLLRCQYCHNPDTWHKLNGQPTPVSRVMHEIAKYAQVLKISHGGVTI